ncbi:MAG: TIGR04283 family arsenosugar biosynthesis glycosyltransferase [Methylosarcina sp.]
MKFSVIVPTLNEEHSILACLSALQALRDRCEIIVVDGGSSDKTRIIAEDWADRLILSEKGRARQMNTGARAATGDVLIFLHADTFLPENAPDLIQQQVERNGEWGRFDVQLSGDHFMFKIIGQLMNWRSRLTGIATGDQALFVTKKAFISAGGYPEIALMEDIAFSKALKNTGPPVCLKARVISSSRKWQQEGIVKTIALMWSLRLQYFFGADPDTLAQRYYRRPKWKR